jgi:hypothetical protein
MLNKLYKYFFRKKTKAKYDAAVAERERVEAEIKALSESLAKNTKYNNPETK